MGRVGVLSSFHVVVKYPDKSKLREKELILHHRSRVQSIMVGKTSQEVLKAASGEAESTGYMQSSHSPYIVLCRS